MRTRPPLSRRSLIRFEGGFASPRMYVFERHIHHFWMGLLVAAYPHPAVRVVGLIWAATDWADRHDWIRDLVYPHVGPGGDLTLC